MHAPNYTEIIETNGDFTYKYFKIGDSGKNLVFLHGLAGCKDSQPHFFKQLLENNTCYFLDLPGHNFLNAGEIKTVESFNLYLNNFYFLPFIFYRGQAEQKRSLGVRAR